MRYTLQHLGIAFFLTWSSIAAQSQPLCDRECQAAMARAAQPPNTNSPYWSLVRDELEMAAIKNPLLRQQIGALVTYGMGGMQASIQLQRRDPQTWQYQQDQLLNEIVNRVARRYDRQKSSGNLRPDVYALFVEEFGRNN